MACGRRHGGSGSIRLFSAPNGTMCNPEIPLSVPNLTGNEQRYLDECLQTTFVSSVGPFVERFEEAFSRQVQTTHAVACASGTAALHVALHVAGVERDDEVL